MTWLIAIVVLVAVCVVIGKRRSRHEADRALADRADRRSCARVRRGATPERAARAHRRRPASPTPRAELVVVALLLRRRGGRRVLRRGLRASAGRRRCSAARSAAALALLAAALIVIAKRLVVTEELAEDYPRRRRPRGAGATSRRSCARAATGSPASACSAAPPALAGGALGAALDRARGVARARCSTPAALNETPWRRGRGGWSTSTAGRCSADDIDAGAFYTAFPEGADREGDRARRSSLVRLDPASCACRRGRDGWAPEGIVAYSKICTHAGCAIALYRNPLFEPTRARARARLPVPLLDLRPGRPAARVLFGPAGRPLPQLPLTIDRGPRRCAPPATSPGPSGPSLVGRAQRDEADPLRDPVALRRRAHGRGAAAAQGAALRCSPTTGRSCSARSRCTRSSCSSATGTSTSRCSSSRAWPRPSTTASYGPLRGAHDEPRLPVGRRPLLRRQGRPADAPDAPLGGRRLRRRDRRAPAARLLHRRVPASRAS